MQPFNHQPVKISPALDVNRLAGYVNRQLERIGAVLRGFSSFTVLGTVVTVNPGMVDLTEINLDANATVTLETDHVRPGAHGWIEFTQDAVGGRAVAFVGNANAAAVSATANKKTLIFCLFNGASWVLSVVASAYA